MTRSKKLGCLMPSLIVTANSLKEFTPQYARDGAIFCGDSRLAQGNEGLTESTCPRKLLRISDRVHMPSPFLVGANSETEPLTLQIKAFSRNAKSSRCCRRLSVMASERRLDHLAFDAGQRR